MKSLSFFRKPLIFLSGVAMIAAVVGAGAFAAPDGSASASPNSTSAGFNVTAIGADGSDAKDDTQAIQTALDQNDSVVIPDGIYYINADVSLHLRSNQTLALSSGATLQALPSSSGNYVILDINGVSCVTVSGGRIVGDRAVHKGTSGEWGMGIKIENGSRNVTVSNITISGCWGDGVYIGGGSSPVRGVTLSGVICDNNRRQGLSITNATQVTVTGCVFKNTKGTAPEAGIDIEPNTGNTTTSITITGTKCYGNAGSGLDLMGIFEHIRNVTATGCDFSNNAGAGIRVSNASDVQFSDITVTGNGTGVEIPRDADNVRCSGLTISDNMLRGISLVTSSQSTGVSNIVFEATTFSNNSRSRANNTDGIRIDRLDASGFIKSVAFYGCRFVDDQPVKTQRYGLTVGYGTGMSDIVLGSSCVFSGNVSGDYLGGGALKLV